MGDYTNNSLILDVYPKFDGITDLTSAHIAKFTQHAEAEVNAKISKLYAIPVNSSMLLESIATDITCYRILTRRVFTAAQLQDSEWPDRWKEAFETLDKIASGEIELLDSSGAIIAARTDVAELSSSTEDFLPTYHEGGVLDHVQDDDKLDTLLDERDL